MADDQTTLKQKVRSGAPLLGAAVPMFSDRARLAQIAARHRYDWFQVDAQHSAFAEVRLRDFCAIAGELSMPVVLRIKHTRHTYLIGNLLDLGPVGIEVPQVELESTVDEAVANFHYPPDGVRSWGGQDRYGFADQPLDEYIELWHRTGVLAMQIESITAATARAASSGRGSTSSPSVPPTSRSTSAATPTTPSRRSRTASPTWPTT